MITPRKPTQTPTLTRQRGFSLLEVLIALVVLTIGLLGLAGLQTFSVKFVHQSYQRTQATLLIYEMMDRMRANGAGVAAGSYALASTNVPPTATDCVATPCANYPDMAAYDMNQWITNITAPTRVGLTQGRGAIGVVAVAAGAPALFDISVSWQEHDLTFTQTIRAQLP